MNISTLHPHFAARVEGIDLSDELSTQTVQELSAALDRHSLLIFPAQRLTPADQVRFSACFGPLERAITRMGDDEVGQQIALLSNINDDGTLADADDRRMLFHRGNEMWHTDSTYKPQTALASLLYAVEVPPVGGQTQFASTRAAYAELDSQRRALVDEGIATHSLMWSRSKVAKDLMSDELQKTLPPVERPMVRINPATGDRSLYIASHAFKVRGMRDDDAQALIADLLHWCTQQRFVWCHDWQVGDLVMWDNRSTLHRATPFDVAKHPRVMRRTTVIDAQYMASLA